MSEIFEWDTALFAITGVAEGAWHCELYWHVSQGGSHRQYFQAAYDASEGMEWGRFVSST